MTQISKHRTAILLAGAAVCILLAAVLVFFLGGWHIELNVNGDTVQQLEYGADYQDCGAEARFCGTRLMKKGKPLAVQISGDAVDNHKLGRSTVHYSADFLWYHAETEREVNVVDTTAPCMTLQYVPDYYTLPGHVYEEEGYSAWDNYDGDLTDSVQRTDYEDFVIYEVTDSSGNTAKYIRYIVYDDRTPPVLTLAGDAVVTLEYGTEYVEPGYSAADDCDGDLTGAVSVVSTDSGYSYSVSDSYGNTATAERTVIWQDTTPPVIYMNGDAEMTIYAGDSFEDPGCTAEDMADGVMEVTAEGEVNAYSAGDYYISYYASDAAGNAASAQRLVHVLARPQAAAADPGAKTVYLTFDDGPGQYTQKLLDVLAKYNVKVTFFVTNQYPAYQNLIAKEAAAGHTVAIHSYSHNYKSIYASEEAYFADLDAMNEIIRTQTGSGTTMVRFPGGSSNSVSNFNSGIMTKLTQDMTDMGYQYYDWNVSSGDAGGTTDTNTVAQNVIDEIQKKNTSVVLMHDIKGYSVDAVEKIISWGIAHGYSFLPLTPSSPKAHHRVNN